MTHSQRMRLIDHRVCFVCRRPVPEARSVLHADLWILAHPGACSDLVAHHRKDYSRSRRGRFLPA